MEQRHTGGAPFTKSMRLRQLAIQRQDIDIYSGALVTGGFLGSSPDEIGPELQEDGPEWHGYLSLLDLG